MKCIKKYFEQRRKERERAAIARMATPAVYSKPEICEPQSVRIGDMSRYEKR